MKNNYLISGIPIMDNNDQGKGFLDISLEDVKFSEDHSDIIAGKVTAQAISYTDGEEFDPIVFEGSDVSLTGAGGGGGTGEDGIQSITISPTIQLTPSLNNYLPMSYERFTEEYPGGTATLGLTSGDIQASTEYSFSVTPGAEWYVADTTDPNNVIFGDKGQPLTIKVATTDEREANVVIIAVDAPSLGPDVKVVLLAMTLSWEDK